MGASEDFFDGMKSDRDRTQEWTDAAQFFVDIRRSPEPEIQPLEKEASVGSTALGILGKIDRTGTVNAMRSSKPAMIAGLVGAGVFGTGMALASRGKKELGGKSGVEHYLAESKKVRDKEPEPPSFSGKVTNNLADFATENASIARKHPVKAGLVAGLGGAAAGSALFSALTRGG